MSRFVNSALLLGLLLGFHVAPAAANGRYPSADQVVLDPNDPSHLLLRATFGVLQSQDGGKSFRWVCEQAVGYSGDRDPALAVLGDGTVLTGFARDLRSSQDGCEWSSMSGVSSENFIDATAEPSDPGRALFLSHSLDSSSQVKVLLAEQGQTELTQLGQPLGTALAPQTLEVAPSDPARLYVTVINNDLSTSLLRSEDRGESWQAFPISPHETVPAYIAAIDPNDADRVYLRLDGDSTDYLLTTDDGGESFSERFSFDHDMLGFALSPDGSQIALGGPDAGILVADTTSFDFTPSPAPITSLTCLKWTAQGLLACAHENADHFTLARSDDAGQSFKPLFHLQDLAPLSCPSDTGTGQRCPNVWPSTAESLGIDTSSPKKKAGGGGCALGHGEVGGGLALFGAAALTWLRRRRRRGF